MSAKQPIQHIHCDPRVVHAPGVCQMCDKFGAIAQELRRAKPLCKFCDLPEDAHEPVAKKCLFGATIFDPMTLDEASAETRAMYERIADDVRTGRVQ
ncbi:MAG: hypothetical protein H0U59_04165 [Gemmatimonadaceae bacterium]|nr:hypothetical protein [Gemmatimonadaceae bacterium]